MQSRLSETVEKHLPKFCPVTRNYIESFRDKNKYADVITALKLPAEKMAMFKKLRDAKTNALMNIPVTIAGHTYDVETMLTFLQPDGQCIADFSNIPFSLEQVMPAKKLIDKIEPILENQIKLSNEEKEFQFFTMITDGKEQQALSYIYDNSLNLEKLNAKNKQGQTPLITALLSGRERIAAALLAITGIDTNTMDDDMTCLMIAAQQGFVRIVNMLCGNNPVNVVNRNGRSALMLAAFHGHLQVVKSLATDPCAALLMQDNEGLTAEDLASRHAETFEFIRNKIQCDLLIACEKGDLAAAQKYLARNPSPIDAMKMFYVAIQKNHTEIVRHFLSTTDVDLSLVYTHSEADKQSAPLLSTETESTRLIKDACISNFLRACTEGNLDLVKKYLLNGSKTMLDALLDARDASGKPAILIATLYNHEAIVSTLLQAGFDVNAMRSYKDTVNLPDGNQEVAEYFGGPTPLFIAVREGYPEIVSLLLKQNGIGVNNYNEYTETVLMIAASNGRIDIVELLLADKQIEPARKDGYSGKTAEDYARMAGHIEVANLIAKSIQQKQGNISANFGGTLFEHIVDVGTGQGNCGGVSIPKCGSL